MSIEEIENSRYALPEGYIPKRIGDMDRNELLRVIAGLRASEQWWMNEATYAHNVV